MGSGLDGGRGFGRRPETKGGHGATSDQRCPGLSPCRGVWRGWDPVRKTEEDEGSVYRRRTETAPSRKIKTF